MGENGTLAGANPNQLVVLRDGDNAHDSYRKIPNKYARRQKKMELLKQLVQERYGIDVTPPNELPTWTRTTRRWLSSSPKKYVPKILKGVLQFRGAKKSYPVMSFLAHWADGTGPDESHVPLFVFWPRRNKQNLSHSGSGAIVAVSMSWSAPIGVVYVECAPDRVGPAGWFVFTAAKEAENTPVASLNCWTITLSRTCSPGLMPRVHLFCSTAMPQTASTTDT